MNDVWYALYSKKYGYFGQLFVTRATATITKKKLDTPFRVVKIKLVPVK